MISLEVLDIHAGYDEAMILHGVSLKANGSDGAVTVIGPNGAGKSTLLKAVMGFLIPERGRITYKGEDITRLRPDERIKKGIAYIPQLDNVFPSLTVEENLTMGGYLLSRSQIREKKEELFEQYPRLAERKNQRAKTLSGGERQMLAMARAMMTDPQLLLFDEPSAALSPNMAEQVFEKIEEIKRQGKGVILVEQDAQRSLEISDQGYVLVDGQNAFQGAADQILSDEKIREAYLGN
ncbi:MAG: ABC transporter ATP-binding protein [Desulfohalobiaceae bacterium]